MNVKLVVSAAAFLAFGLGDFSALSSFAGRGLPRENAPFLLEEKYDRESNPKKRVLIAIKLMEVSLKQIRFAYKTEVPTKGEEAIEQYLSAVDRLERAEIEAADTGYSKRAEIHLRQQARGLENLKISLSVMDRALVEKAVKRVTSLRETILYNIMDPREASARK